MVKKAGYSEEDYRKKEKEMGEENMRQIEKIISLRTLDMLWLEHLENMEYLRDSVRLRAYGQQDPLVEYKNEGHKMFQRLLSTMESTIANTIFRVSLAPAPPSAVSSSHQNKFGAGQASAPAQPLERKPGRNDPCPCGSGKKYKKCCWPKYG
jgi:preprotein translocase subunit SecA